MGCERVRVRCEVRKSLAHHVTELTRMSLARKILPSTKCCERLKDANGLKK